MTAQIISSEKRAECAKAAEAIETIYRAIPKAQRKSWWQRGPWEEAIMDLRTMSNYGNGFGVLVTAHDEIATVAKSHGVTTVKPSAYSRRENLGGAK